MALQQLSQTHKHACPQGVIQYEQPAHTLDDKAAEVTILLALESCLHMRKRMSMTEAATLNVP